MNRPSSTITAATLAGSGITLMWGLLGTFSTIEPTALVVSASTVFVTSLAGYFKRENVLPLKKAVKK